MANKKQYKKVERLSDEMLNTLLEDLPRSSKFTVLNNTSLDYIVIGKVIEALYKTILVDDVLRKDIINGEERMFGMEFTIGSVRYEINGAFNIKGDEYKHFGTVFRVSKVRDLTNYEATRKVGTPDFVKKGFSDIS